MVTLIPNVSDLARLKPTVDTNVFKTAALKARFIGNLEGPIKDVLVDGIMPPQTNLLQQNRVSDVSSAQNIQDIYHKLNNIVTYTTVCSEIMYALWQSSPEAYAFFGQKSIPLKRGSLTNSDQIFMGANFLPAQTY